MKQRRWWLGTLLIAGASLAATGCTGPGGSAVTGEEIRQEGSVIWSGPTVSFSKADGADPALAENQDRVTDSVWITRGNDGGQIFNAQERANASKPESPVGTLWAVGTTDDIPDLEFRRFRPTVGKPRSVPGTNLVMYIEAEQIFVDVTFQSWSQGKAGGFSYERGSPGPEQ